MQPGFSFPFFFFQFCEVDGFMIIRHPQEELPNLARGWTEE
jgi:hypothetical protein